MIDYFFRDSVYFACNLTMLTVTVAELIVQYGEETGRIYSRISSVESLAVIRLRAGVGHRLSQVVSNN